MTVLTPHAVGVPSQWSDEGVTVSSFRYAPPRLELLGYSRSLRSDERVRAAAALVFPLYAVAARRSLRRHLERTAFDLVHAHWVVPNGLIASSLLASRPRLGGASERVPLAVGLHGSDVFLAEKRGVRRLVGRSLRRVALVTGCSPELVERVRVLGLPHDLWRVIPYGVDPELFVPRGDESSPWRRRLDIPEQSPLLLSVGRMATKKGYHVLLEALPGLLSRHPELQVVLAGGGDRLRELEARARAWRDRVHFPGPVPHDELPGLYRAADLFVLPAVHDPSGNVDGLPNVILEAMASGLPVVASRISGIPLAVESERQGLLVEEGDASALVEALHRLLRDRAWRRELGGEARRKVERELTWDHIASRYREAYLEVVDSPSRGR